MLQCFGETLPEREVKFAPWAGSIRLGPIPVQYILSLHTSISAIAAISLRAISDGSSRLDVTRTRIESSLMCRMCQSLREQQLALPEASPDSGRMTSNWIPQVGLMCCLLYTSDAADD